jgi:hypothetical protein
MSLDLTGKPLIDREDFYQLLEQGQFGRWSMQATQLHEQGFCVLDLSEPDFLVRTSAVAAELEPLLAEQLCLWERGETGPPRLQDGWIQHPTIQALALEPMVFDVLRHLYGREPFAFQTLNFAVGSEQPYHSDAVHFHSYPQGFMCGVWIALQDVRPESGPLHYYPGSHRLPYLSAESLALDPIAVAAEPHPQRFFQNHWHQSVLSANFEKQQFLPRRGEILIWHANLLHGGEPVRDRTSRRWSQVVHYYFADCLYTTPLRSFRRSDGGPCLRNPYDIATGHRRYSRQDWQAMGCAQSPTAPPASQG